MSGEKNFQTLADGVPGILAARPEDIREGGIPHIDVNDPAQSRGLTAAQYQASLEYYGRNEIKAKPPRHMLLKLLDQFKGFFSMLLMAGAILCFIAVALDPLTQENLYLGIVLFTVVCITCFFTWRQEAASENLMAKFAGMGGAKATVIRDGVQDSTVDKAEVVPGDLVVLKKGDAIPADCQCIKVDNFKCLEPALTGEPDAVRKKVDNPQKKTDLRAPNLVMTGTEISDGTCMAVIIGCGNNTVMGDIASMAMSSEARETPLNLEIKRFVKLISGIAIFLGVTFFFINIGKGADFVNNVVFTIGIIVANVPEGLLATVTVCLALTARRMKQVQVLVKNLESVETLGSTSVICSDKTGTLTQGKMTAVVTVMDNATYKVKYPPRGGAADAFAEGGGGGGSNKMDSLPIFDHSSGSGKAFIRCACLCATSKFVKKDKVVGKTTIPYAQQHVLDRECTGDPTESSVLKLAESALVASGPSQMSGGVEEFRNTNPYMCGLPFDSRVKYMVSVNSWYENGQWSCYGITLKGGWDVVVNMASLIMINGEEQPMTEEKRAQIKQLTEDQANNGYRCLALAHSYLDPKQWPKRDGELPMEELQQAGVVPLKRDQAPPAGDLICNPLVLLGVVAIQDPPRAGVDRSVRECREAAIQVVMVTGDHVGTGRAIAKQIGILDPSNPDIIDVCQARGLKYPDQKDQLTSADLALVTARVVSGDEINELKAQFPEDAKFKDLEKNPTYRKWWEDVILKNKDLVFGRTSPKHKKEIVGWFQKLKDATTAVTGDGVNDSPALKQGDIGICMAIAGTDVTREAADMLLMDDNFCSIVNGVKEGRLIFDNLKKSIAYTLSSNIPEIAPFLMFIILGLPLPLSTVLILCIDLGTDMVPAISLAYETPEANIMKKPPRPKHDNLVTSRLISFAYFQIGVMQALAGFFVYMVVMVDKGYHIQWLPQAANHHFLTNPKGESAPWAGHSYLENMEDLMTAQSAYMFSIIVVQWADLIICKTREKSVFQHGMMNKVLDMGLIFETVLGCVLLYTPGLSDVLGIRQLRFIHMLPAIPWSLWIFIYDECRKAIIRKHPFGWIKEKTYW